MHTVIYITQTSNSRLHRDFVHGCRCTYNEPCEVGNRSNITSMYVLGLQLMKSQKIRWGCIMQWRFNIPRHQVLERFADMRVRGLVSCCSCTYTCVTWAAGHALSSSTVWRCRCACRNISFDDDALSERSLVTLLYMFHGYVCCCCGTCFEQCVAMFWYRTSWTVNKRRWYGTRATGFR